MQIIMHFLWLDTEQVKDIGFFSDAGGLNTKLDIQGKLDRITECNAV
jgi:hypothetical protein